MHTVINSNNIEYAHRNNSTLADCLITDPWFPSDLSACTVSDLSNYTGFTYEWLSVFINTVPAGAYIAIHQPSWTMHYCIQAMISLDLFIKDYLVAVKQHVNCTHRGSHFTLFPDRDAALNSAATFWIIGQKRPDGNGNIRVPGTYNLPINNQVDNCIISDSIQRKFHQSQQPANIIRYLVNLLSYPGMTVIDPFAGSGEVAVAASECARNSISIEINPRHCATILSRLPKKYTTFIAK